MNADVAQLERNNNKYCGSAFRYIEIEIDDSWKEMTHNQTEINVPNMKENDDRE